MVGVPYATRESVMDALDTRAGAYRASQVDKAIQSASRRAESLCHRIFYPLTATKSFSWPNVQDESSTLWLDNNELASVTTFTSGGSVIPGAGYYLEPQADGPPYNRIEINRGSSYGLSAGSSGSQRALSVAGVWCGCPVDEEDAGTASAIASTSATSITLTVPTGVGSILRIDSERMIVTEKAWSASGQTGSLTASMADQTLTVSNGALFAVRETILLDAELILVLAISGNNLIVRRAVQGSTLAAHTTASISWTRTFMVTRGALGTTAATHSGAPVYRYVVPDLVEQFTIAYAIDRQLQEISGYARTVGSADNQIPASGSGLAQLTKALRSAHGRMARFRSV